MHIDTWRMFYQDGETEHSLRVSMWLINCGHPLGKRAVQDWSGIGICPARIDTLSRQLRVQVRPEDSDPCCGITTWEELDWDELWYWRQRVITNDL